MRPVRGGGTAIKQTGVRQHKSACAYPSHPAGLFPRTGEIRTQPGRNILGRQLAGNHQRIGYDT
ncbi:hypothetical protein D3C78_1386910 [compost metagenome]